jgi:hypothetical protein
MAGTFTYTYDPTNVPIDAVRFTLQDTDEDNVLLWDQEINYLLSQTNDNIIRASILGARAIMAKFARMADREQAGKYQVYYTDKVGQYQTIIDSLEDQLSSLSGVDIHYGGIDIDTVDSVRKDNTRVHNLFHTDRLLSIELESPEKM